MRLHRTRVGPCDRTRVRWSDSVVVWGYEFQRGGDFPGRVVVDVDTGTRRVVSVAVHPERLSLSEAIDMFGPKFQRTRYARDECLGDGESTPLYELPGGPIEYLENRARGIAIPVEVGDSVREVYYRDGTPLGAAAPAVCSQVPAY